VKRDRASGRESRIVTKATSAGHVPQIK
jgi:hypothetical protein